MGVNIKRIAEIAGTSPASVSLVLNEKWRKKVRPDLARRIRRIARRRGYAGSPAARGLVLGRHFRVALCVGPLPAEHPVLGVFSTYELLSIISSRLNGRGYAVE